MSDNNNISDGEKDLVIDWSHIGCDCCGKPGPTKNCSRCLSSYYCNRECQLKHWKEHKQQCMFLKEERDTYMRTKRNWEEFQDKEKKKSRDKPDECAICLEEIEIPISLECGHIFCASCLMQYHSSNPKKSSCPNCRGDMGTEQLGATAARQMSAYVERANRSHGAEKEMYTQLAIRQTDAILGDYQSSDDRRLHDQYSLPLRVSVLRKLNRHHEVIETVDELLNLCSDAEYSIVNAGKILEVRIAKADAHLKLEEWQTALDMFKLLHEDCKEKHQGYCINIAVGISRAQYELQNYYEAIIEGDMVTNRHNRFLLGVHKYIALSQMKLGDIAAAKKSITRGIFYEEQWNEENRKENEEVLRMILAEEAKNNKPKGKKKGKKNRGKK